MEITLPGFSVLHTVRFLAVFVILFLPIVVFSQSTLNNCDPVYEKALTAYREGRINDVPTILKDCLENWQGEREADAHKLLTNTYLYFNERAQAENAMLNFLKLNSEYAIDADSTSENRDTPEFINLYNTFRTRPIFLIGAKAGGNWSFINGTKGFSLDNEAFTEQEYNGRLGYQAGISAEIPVWKQFAINPEFYLLVKGYKETSTIMDFAKISFTETQYWADLPLTLKYNVLTKNRNRVPFISIGSSVQYLIHSNADLDRKDIDVMTGSIARALDPKPVNVTNMRNRLNYNAIIGAGIKLKNVIGKGLITIEGRYTHGLRNIVNPEKRAAGLYNSDLVYDFLHIDNNFTMNTFSVSLGYIMPQYKPKVLRKR
ncbi:PorT family protein [Rhodocytophaga rosea]|uniref:PorT family protein n=1 Tax=Rhodocytophaga rosea TaxID=2704465 RepID=A0A6C0GDN8_9BACT|nr:porin family protein [Rhodocytophaga rosea]QHT66037.1 PorT family protein [Rhodocytophaga rosea]